MDQDTEDMGEIVCKIVYLHRIGRSYGDQIYAAAWDYWLEELWFESREEQLIYIRYLIRYGDVVIEDW